MLIWGAQRARPVGLLNSFRRSPDSILVELSTHRGKFGMHDWSPSPWGEAMRLAADAADLRRQLNPRELARAPRLAAALDACDALFEELGWGNPWNRPAEDDEAGR